MLWAACRFFALIRQVASVMTWGRTTMFICPNCGAEVEDGAFQCPDCGSDEETGWSEEAAYDGLDLPDPDDSRGLSRGDSSPDARNAVAIGVVVLIVLLILLGLW